MLYHFKLFKAGKEETRIVLWVCFFNNVDNIYNCDKNTLWDQWLCIY